LYRRRYFKGVKDHALEWLSDMSFDNVDFALESKVTIDFFHHDHVDNVNSISYQKISQFNFILYSKYLKDLKYSDLKDV